MEFKPEGTEGPTSNVPYLDEARAADGWQGQETNLSYDRLKSELTGVMARLGGIVHGFQRGIYTIGDHDRAGVQVRYSVEGPGGAMIYGRLDVAALPIKEPTRNRYDAGKILRGRQEKALAMALYNVVHSLRAQWVLKQLNPGYIPLMPWLLAKGGHTLSELYADAGFTKALMPPKAEKFVEGNFREVEEA